MLFFSRASYIMDFVAIAMVVVVCLLLASIKLVKNKHYRSHKIIQLALAGTLAVVLVVFEVHVRMVGWREATEVSPFSITAIGTVLAIHIAIASVTTVTWIVTITKALKGFPSPPMPSAHSRQHKTWARVAAIGMVLTAVTGWIFFWMAFMAT